ncbi:uncharacterized protein LOC113302913 isoform X2 [Papaver somniferum]|uniref:uncharacterized protein LOC113302913 isoform X2 n=1 Tax=Papaver somniferum TaxID=3469 RepID=UPI000E6F7827|nr:uncharacterized protein LOC113302913 isoform X2 [Papaver somniferum]
MKRRVLLICIGVGFLGVLAAALGFGAESERIKESEINFIDPGKCTYPRTPAFALGLTAFFVLIVAHAIINASAGCICCNKLSGAWVTFCAVFSWLMSALASILLLAGSLLNDRHTVDERNQMGTPSNTDNHGNIAMTQPQVPAQMTQQPVFVPEETYNRRQFV